jgi:hypothetical protein
MKDVWNLLGSNTSKPMQDVVLHLPEPVLLRAQQAADALQQPIDEILTTLVAAALPDVSDAPPELQTELARMAWMSTEDLWSIAQHTMPEIDDRDLQTLALRQAEQRLSEQEEKRLQELRSVYGRITLLKARAYALLSLRGGRPLLAEG